MYSLTSDTGLDYRETKDVGASRDTAIGVQGVNDFTVVRTRHRRKLKTQSELCCLMTLTMLISLLIPELRLVVHTTYQQLLCSSLPPPMSL